METNPWKDDVMGGMARSEEGRLLDAVEIRADNGAVIDDAVGWGSRERTAAESS